jgi:hypothetical protein
LRPRTPGGRSRAMGAILTIVVFLAVVAGLNRFEFGRFD